MHVLPVAGSYVTGQAISRRLVGAAFSFMAQVSMYGLLHLCHIGPSVAKHSVE